MSRFRIQYRSLSQNEQKLIEAIKIKAEELDELFKLAEVAPATVTTEIKEKIRLGALSRTNLEQAVMWGVKAITG